MRRGKSAREPGFPGIGEGTSKRLAGRGDKRCPEKEEAPNGGSGASSIEFPAGTVMGGNAITVIAKYSNLAACRDFSAKMVKVNNLQTKGRAKMVL